MFHDEPSVETLNAISMSAASATTSSTRDRRAAAHAGGGHPEDGCYFPDEPYKGAQFDWLAANVVRKDNGETLLPATAVRTVNGVEVGFIGMTLEATPTLVSPAGVASVDFKDEVETANRQAELLVAAASSPSSCCSTRAATRAARSTAARASPRRSPRSLRR